MTNSITCANLLFDVSILIPNYNNAEYLEECLNSVFSQKTTINYLVIIADDKSTDNSVEIIENYLKKFPEKTIFIKLEKNIGTLGATLELYKKIETQYFTVLDSDDYWIDDNFLERSVDFLEKNDDYSSYSNNTKMYYMDTEKEFLYFPEKIIFCGYDKKENTIHFSGSHTSSTVFRSDCISKYSLDRLDNILEINNNNNNFVNNIYCNLYEGDTFRNCLSSSFGKCYCDNTIVSGLYRMKTENSRWSSLAPKLQKLLNFLFYFEISDFFKFNKTIQTHILNCYDMNISSLFKILDFDNLKSEITYYNKKIVTIDDYAQVVYKAIGNMDRLNHVSETIKYFKKRFLFFLPSKHIGGFEILFLNFAKQLSLLGYDVSYIDFEKGHFSKMIGPDNNIELITFPDFDSLLDKNYTIQHEDHVNLIMPLTMSGEVKINLSEKSNVMYYMAHPESVDFLAYRARLSSQQTIDHILKIKTQICCQDEINQKIMSEITHFDNKILPIFVNNDYKFAQKTQIVNLDEINVGYMSRLDMDKIFCLVNLLNNLALYTTPLKKNLHIIGTNTLSPDSLNLINFDYYKTIGINLIFTGLLLDEYKYLYLHNNVDIVFSVGTVPLEVASIKIPSVMHITQSNDKFNDDKFVYLCDLKKINNGFYEKDISKLDPINFSLFSNIMDDIYIKNKIVEIGNKCYDYYNENHSLNVALYKFIEYFNT